jgi:hypothetical protein
MNQGTQGYSLTKKTEGRKSRDIVSLNAANSKPTSWKCEVVRGPHRCPKIPAQAVSFPPFRARQMKEERG